MLYLLIPQIYCSLLTRTFLKLSFPWASSFDLKAADNYRGARRFISKCSFLTLVMTFSHFSLYRSEMLTMTW